MRTLSRFAVIGLACGWLLAVSFAPARASNYHDFEKMWRLVPGQANALLLHVDHHHIDLAAKVPVENQRRHRHRNAACGVVQRHRNTVRQLSWILS